jgi:hypothetical protein
MGISVADNQYVVIRMAYVGPNTSGKLLISSGNLDNLSIIHAYKRFDIMEDKQSKAISGSDAIINIHNITQTTDGNSGTFYLSKNNTGVGILYDLGKFHRITTLHVESFAGSDAPKRCLLQLELSTAAGE